LPGENVTVVANSFDIDFRGIPVWERVPLVLAALDRAPQGASVSCITDIEPRGLSARVRDEGFGPVLVETSALGGQLWRLRFTRQTGEATANPIARVLQAAPPFARLPDESLARLVGAASSQAANRGRVMVDGKGIWPYVGVVAEGVVAVANGGGERNPILYEAFPLDTFGIGAFFDRGAPLGSVVVMTKSARIVKVPWDALAAIAHGSPELLLGLGNALANVQRLLAQKLAAQSVLPIVGRVARVLLPHAMPSRGLSPAMPALATMTQSQIAAAAGTVKEVAARAIAELDERGLLKRERGHIRFLDRQGLIELLRELGES
jgi:CRP-like cAMP-binding protein/uncharacterized protein (DUF2249 family)